MDDVWLSSASPLDVLAVLELCAARRHLLLLSPKGREHALAWVDVHARDGSALKVQLMHVLEANRRAGTSACVVTSPIVAKKRTVTPPAARGW